MKKSYLCLLLAAISSTAQVQWQPLSSIPDNPSATNRYDDVFFLNENLGWAANGASAAIYKTTNGGATWALQLSEFTAALPGNNYIRNVEFLNENIGFVGTLNGKFLRTNDGGSTWNVVTNFPTNPQAICGIDCVGESTVYGCGAYFSPAYVIKSTDAGLSWSYIDMSAYAVALVEVLFVDENIGYASGQSNSGGTVIKTTDGGITWTEIYNSNIVGEYVWKLQILDSDPDVIFGSVETVAPNMGHLIRSIDNGVSWTSHDVPDPDIQAVGFLTQDHGFMGGHNSGFLETFDGGVTWSPFLVNGQPVGSNLNRIQFLSNNLAYASGKTIYKFSDASLGNSSFQEGARIPLKAFINPNPVKDKLNVSIEFLENDHLRLELYDASGRRIKELMRDNIPGAATKTYTFDFPYAHGTYLINLHTNTGRQSIKFVK